MGKKYLTLNDILAYKMSYKLSNVVWDNVTSWNIFAKKTIGEQWVRAVDSISANIAEGFGRYHKNDKIKFYRYAIGSLKESLDWNEKAKQRKLISHEEYNKILNELLEIPKEIYKLIKFTQQKLEK